MRYTHPTCDTCQPYVPETVDHEYDDNLTDGVQRIIRETRMRKMKEEAEAKERAQANTVEEDKPESEYIPLKTDKEDE